MSHYAFLDGTSTVVEVVPGPVSDGSTDWEAYFTAQKGMTCKRTDIDAVAGNGYRKNFAGIGYYYNPTLDAFIPPVPGPAEYWTLNTFTCQWIQTPAGSQFYISQAVNQHLDAVVAERQYNGIDSMPKYLTSTNARYAAESAAAVAWCTAVWEKVEEIQQQVLSGQRPIPSPTEVIAELPVIQWPA